MLPPDIIEKAAELALPQFLNWLATKSWNFSKEQWDKVYEIIRAKNDRKEYGFVPNREEVEALKKLAEKSAYTEFHELLPHHWGIDVVRTGLYIATLERQDRDNTERIKAINDQVFKNKKLLGLRLLEMTVVGVIDPVIDHLKTLKEKHQFAAEDLEATFESILATWKKITIFVKGDDTKDHVMTQIRQMLTLKEETFFVYASGKAKDAACFAIAELNNASALTGYVWFSRMNPETHPPSYYCGFYSSTFLL
jgi:hypothetical protein